MSSNNNQQKQNTQEKPFNISQHIDIKSHCYNAADFVSKEYYSRNCEMYGSFSNQEIRYFQYRFMDAYKHCLEHYGQLPK